MHGDRERFLSRGCDDYLSKPLQMRELLARVDGFFERQEADEDDFDYEDNAHQSLSDATVAGAADSVVLEAADGESGLRTAMTSIPDLILRHGIA